MAKATNKQKKRKARERRLVRERNIRKNQAETQFHLMVNFVDDGGWKRMMNFKNSEQVDMYLKETKQIREEGKDRIFEGVIYNKLGREVARIPAYDPPEGVTPEKASQTSGKLDLEAAKG